MAAPKQQINSFIVVVTFHWRATTDNVGISPKVCLKWVTKLAQVRIGLNFSTEVSGYEADRASIVSPRCRSRCPYVLPLASSLRENTVHRIMDKLQILFAGVVLVLVHIQICKIIQMVMLHFKNTLSSSQEPQFC